jgi:hypothetical protein
LSGNTEIPKQYQNDEVFDTATNLQIEQQSNPEYDLDSVIETIEDSDFIISSLLESAASDKAKKLGLVHLGFGMYGRKKEGSPKYKTVDGKLVKATKSDAENKKKGEEEKQKSKKNKGLQMSDIKSVQRLKGQKYTYSYIIVGHKPQNITLNKKEVERLNVKHDSVKDIIFKRLKDIEKKKKLKIGK